MVRKFFSNQKAYERQVHLHPKMKDIAADFIQFSLEEGVEEPVITETVTTKAEDRALSRTSESHNECRAIDGRTRNMTTEQRQRVMQRLLTKYRHIGYMNKKGERVLVYYHDNGNGPHLHIALFGLMIFGLYYAILDKEYGLALGILSVCFVFMILLSKDFKLKNFVIGGKWLRISINEQTCEKSDKPAQGGVDEG